MPSSPVIDSITATSASKLRIAYHNSGTGDHNRLYRSAIGEYGGLAVKIADPIAWSTAGAIYDDFAVASDVPYTYQMVAVDASGNTAASATANGSVHLVSAWLHSVTKYDPVQNAVLSAKLAETGAHARDYGLASLARVLGNALAPVVGLSGIEELGVQIPIVVPFGSADRETIRSMFLSRLYCCLRTGLGNKWFGRIQPVDENYGGAAAVTVLGFQVLDFRESVA